MAKRIKYVPNIVRGGTAIPINSNTFLLRGRKHEQGGIDIGKDVEAEDGELLQINKNNIKILSNAPIMKGKSPAKYALRGTYDGTFKNRFNKGFNYQEQYKDRNHLNDDGTKQKEYSNKAKVGKFKKFLQDAAYKIITQNREHDKEKADLINIINGLNTDNPIKVTRNKYLIGGSSNQEVNYIGSDLKGIDGANDVRLKAIELGNIAPIIYNISKKENINPNLLLNRFMREGYLDSVIKKYNSGSKYWLDNIQSLPIKDTELGLDYLAKLYEDGVINLDDLNFKRNENKRKGEPIKGGIDFYDLNSGLTAMARALKYYENSEVVKRHPENKETFTNLAYNVGPGEAKKFKDRTAIQRYTIPDYFKFRNLDERYTKEIEEQEEKELIAQDEKFQKDLENEINKKLERIRLKNIPLSNVKKINTELAFK